VTPRASNNELGAKFKTGTLRTTMNNNFDTTQNIHIYKPKRWTLALNIFSLFFVGIIMGIPLIAFVLMAKSLVRAQSELNSFAIVFGCLFIPIIILLGFNIVQMTINTILSFFSYTKISPEGIEQKYSIYKHIRSNWSDVDKLGKLFLFTDVLYLNSFEVVGPSLSLKSPFMLLRPKQGFITLSGFEGWSEGQLAHDLKQYAPKLFENQQIFQQEQAENRDVQIKETPIVDASQENRLLAALSHASVLFSSPGVIVPIVIYATQRKKSSFVGFQALQALIWQIVAFVFTLLASSCMVGAILIPVLFATSSQNTRGLELSSGGIFVMMMVSVFLMIFGNMAFIIYGIVGAIMAYRGKDFRYIFIGNRVDKSKGAKPAGSA
jgi:uncharacterized Tic20 family protein